MRDVQALILTGYGINCEKEMAAAYTLAGALCQIHHVNDLWSEKIDLFDFDIINFPGGFSFGDDLGSGMVLANKIRFKKTASDKNIFNQLVQFVRSGKYILGVCNGFQVLVKLGLLPDTLALGSAIRAGDLVQEVTLRQNESRRFEDRWVKLKVNPSSPTPFLKGLNFLELPVRHGEGQLRFASETVRQKVIQQNLNCLSYVDEEGKPTQIYPQNPNGSDLASAALCDPTGRIFGIMPHPEAYLSLYNHPSWGSLKRQDKARSEEGDGLKIFQNIVSYIESEKQT